MSDILQISFIFRYFGAESQNNETRYNETQNEIYNAPQNTMQNAQLKVALPPRLSLLRHNS